jgi:Ricin-type beta-trefoil lectin domain
MRGIRSLAVCIALGGLLAAGAVGMNMATAHADTTVTSCLGAGDASTPYKCTVTGTISDPATVTVGVTDTTASGYENVTVNWTVQCTDNANGTLGTAGAPAASATPVTLGLTLPTNNADSQCAVSAAVALSPPYTSAAYAECLDTTASPTPIPTPDPTPTSTPPPCASEFQATLSYTSAASPSSSSSSSSSGSVHPVKGYDGKCLDDKGNSSSNRAEVVIWGCSGSDQAENWKYSSSEFSHNGKCLNDKGDGGSGTKVILYSCNGGSNEKWSELANGELKLQAHGGTLCLDDPGYSKKNGTQLIVYACHDSANQKWSLP